MNRFVKQKNTVYDCDTSHNETMNTIVVLNKQSIMNGLHSEHGAQRREVVLKFLLQVAVLNYIW